MNRKEIYGKGHTYLITRRFLPGGKATGRMRVRVQIFEGIRYSWSVPVSDDHRDYDDMHEGDMIFARHITKINNHVSKEN